MRSTLRGSSFNRMLSAEFGQVLVVDGQRPIQQLLLISVGLTIAPPDRSVGSL
jgi:hypothetical protein